MTYLTLLLHFWYIFQNFIIRWTRGVSKERSHCFDLEKHAATKHKTQKECLWRISKHYIFWRTQFHKVFLSLWKFAQKMGEFSTILLWNARTVIKFLNVKGVTGLEIHRKLNNVHSAGNVMSLCHIYKWTECFNAVCSDTHDEQQTGYLLDSINHETIACVHILPTEDHRFTISNIHREMAECYLM